MENRFTIIPIMCMIKPMVNGKKRLETEIADKVTRFCKDFLGRGPLETRVYILEDMVIVRMKDALTPAEQKLADRADCNKCWDLVKQMRTLLVEQGREQLEGIILETLEVRVISLHDDVSTKTGESILLFVLEKKPVFEQIECWRD
ncbi:MAG: DUF2294 domain-containing protein [Spirochaetales bacterium]|nr:DUF2294 domain-containing protein [Spirochaetales bacterium]